MTSMKDKLFTINFVKENIDLLKKYIDETVSEDEKPYFILLIKTHLETSLLESLVETNGIQNKKIMSNHDGNKKIEAQLISKSVTITFEYTEDDCGRCVSPLLPVSIEMTSSPAVAELYKRLNELGEIFSAKVSENKKIDPSLITEYNSLINLLNELNELNEA